MSNVAPEPVRPEVPDWDRLELVVRRLMDDHDTWRRRALTAEKRNRELETTLAEISAGRLDPAEVSARARSLERENRVLAKRMQNARDIIERILDRIEFVEENR